MDGTELKKFESPKLKNIYRYPVSEIFPAVQGEGQLIGRPTTFIRLGGCDYRCRWPVAIDTPIVTYDGRHVAAGTIRVGDELIGMAARKLSKDPVLTVRGQPIPVRVTGVEHASRPCFEVSFENHNSVVVGDEHYFFRVGNPNSGRARSIKNLKPGDRLKAFQKWRMRPGDGYHEIVDKHLQYRRNDFARVTDIKPIGEKMVAAIQTDGGSFYDANGLLHKNCDSMFSVLQKYKDQWAKLTPGDIVSALRFLETNAGVLWPKLITLSGGNPALHRIMRK